MSACVALIDEVVAAHELPGDFSAELTQSAIHAAKNPVEVSREDFRELHLFTIDGEDARDFDDAVAAAPLPNGGFRLWTAIADVAAFVKDGSPLDKEARRRGNSVYFPDRVLPMLPDALSNDACSLSPDQDKLCLLCEMDIVDGEVKKYRFARGIMRSRRRLTYEDAADGMQNDVRPLTDLAAAGKALRQARKENGAFMMERPEWQAIIADGETTLRECRRNKAHWVIEECMIAANRCAADFVIRRRLPTLHRIHRKPSTENVRNLSRLLGGLGVDFPARPVAADFGRALEAIVAKDEGLADCIVPVLLGTLSRAEYAPDEKTGHFGLSCSRYLHFTSPIRRYPDLLVHRAIIAGLSKQNKQKVAVGDLAALGAHCSQTETAADKAGWDCRQRLLCHRAMAHVGQEFDAMVSGVAPFGIFVAVRELGVDGMIRLSSLPGYWRYDEKKREISANGRVLGLGMRLRTRLASAMPEKGRANFEPTTDTMLGR